MNIMNLYKKTCSIIVYLITGLVILSTSTMIGIQIYNTYLEIIIIFLGIMSFILLGETKIEKRIINYMLILLLVLIVEMIYYPSTIFYFVRVMLMICALIFAFKLAIKNNIDIITIFYQLFLILCSISSIVYVLVEVLQMSLPYTVFSLEWTNTYKNYYNIYYARHDTLLGTFGGVELIRNCGFFSEPGMYCTFIDVCILIHLFYLKEKKSIHLFILILAAITTTSTTGLIVLMVILLYYIIFIKGYRGRGLLVLIGAPLVMVVVFVIYEVLSDKALNHANSFGSRFFDLIGGFQLFIKKPILGWGFKNTEAYYEAQEGMFNGLRDNSNGVITILYQLGIMGVVMYLYPFVTTYKKIIDKKKKEISIFIFVVFVVLLLSQPFEYMSLGLALLAYLITHTTK